MQRPPPPPRDGLPYFTRIPTRAPQAAVDQDVDLRPTRDLGQGAHVQREDPNHVDGHADASYPGYGVYATLDGSRVDTSEFADPEWAGAQLEPDRPPRPDRGRDFEPRGDAELTAELRALLHAEAGLDAASVGVSVEGGEVLLAGLVADLRRKHLAEDLAYRVAGVLDVTNLLIVGPEGPPQRAIDDPGDAPQEEYPNMLPHSLRGPSEDAALRRLGAEDRHEDRRHRRDA